MSSKMVPKAERVLEEALSLPEDARIALAEALLESVEPGPGVAWRRFDPGR